MNKSIKEFQLERQQLNQHIARLLKDAAKLGMTPEIMQEVNDAVFMRNQLNELLENYGYDLEHLEDEPEFQMFDDEKKKQILKFRDEALGFVKEMLQKGIQGLHSIKNSIEKGISLAKAGVENAFADVELTAIEQRMAVISNWYQFQMKINTMLNKFNREISGSIDRVNTIKRELSNVGKAISGSDSFEHDNLNRTATQNKVLNLIQAPIDKVNKKMELTAEKYNSFLEKSLEICDNRYKMSKEIGSKRGVDKFKLEKEAFELFSVSGEPTDNCVTIAVPSYVASYFENICDADGSFYYINTNRNKDFFEYSFHQNNEVAVTYAFECAVDMLLFHSSEEVGNVYRKHIKQYYGYESDAMTGSMTGYKDRADYQNEMDFGYRTFADIDR